MYFSVGVVPSGSGLFLTIALFSLWRLAPDSFSESARSDSLFRRDWCEESRPLWPLSGTHLFILNDKNFGQPLPQIAIHWEDSSAMRGFPQMRRLAEGTRCIRSHDGMVPRPALAQSIVESSKI